MSRPSSRASLARPPSSLSSFATVTSYGTPQAKSKADSTRYGGLSAKQADKISEAIASVRKTTRGRPGDPISEESEPDNSLSRDKGKGRAVPSGAFAERISFAAAPLTSRLVPASPHRMQALARSQKQGDLPPNILGGLNGRPGSALSREEPPQAVALEAEYAKQRDALPADLHVQEAMIIEDLLHVLMGIEGQYIEYAADFDPEDEYERLRGARFSAHQSLDRSLGELAERVLPVAMHFTAVHAYVEKHCFVGFGLVTHALTAALRDLLRDHLELVAQLEHQFNASSTFTLQRLWLLVQPIAQRLACAYRLTLELAAVPDRASEQEAEESSELDSDDDDDEDDTRRSAKGHLQPYQAGPARGGEVLALLETRLLRGGGDPVASDLLSNLLLRASQPYAHTLLDWITTGTLNDPHDEFIVLEDKALDQAVLVDDYVEDYWEKRYTLKDAALGRRAASLDEARELGLAGAAILPSCLANHREKMLMAGKYLNVLRECGVEIKEQGAPGSRDIAIDQPSFLESIDAAYTRANEALLRLLIDDQQLLARLRSFKHYFFIDCGDALTSFLDSARGDLARPAKSISLSKLQSLLDIALRNPSSASSSDPYKEDVRAGLSKETLIEYMTGVNSVGGSASPAESSAKSASSSATPVTGFDSFVLDYSIGFPLSLVFSRKTIFQYQLIFRFLLQLRHAENQLSSLWLEHAKSPVWRDSAPGGHRHPGLERWKARAFRLRTTMSAFLRHVHAYATGEVLEPKWTQLVGKLSHIKTVDQLLHDHVQFLADCCRDLMMADSEPLKLFGKLLSTCHMLAAYQATFTKALSAAHARLQEVQGDPARVDISQPEATLYKFERHFFWHLTQLCQVLTLRSSQTPAFLALNARLTHLRAPA